MDVSVFQELHDRVIRLRTDQTLTTADGVRQLQQIAVQAARAYCTQAKAGTAGFNPNVCPEGLPFNRFQQIPIWVLCWRLILQLLSAEHPTLITPDPEDMAWTEDPTSTPDVGLRVGRDVPDRWRTKAEGYAAALLILERLAGTIPANPGENDARACDEVPTHLSDGKPAMPADARAAASYEWACKQRPELLIDDVKYPKALWEFIKEADCPAYQDDGQDLPVPKFLSWTRMVRRGLNSHHTAPRLSAKEIESKSITRINQY